MRSFVPGPGAPSEPAGMSPEPRSRSAPEGVDPVLADPNPTRPSQPSVFYRAGIWRVGQWTVRLLPETVSFWLARGLAGFYWRARPARREVVMGNLAPVLDGDRAAARISARELFRQFSMKLVDLLRFESGLSISHLFHQFTGWENYTAAEARKRGVLLLTIHLGNWEFGAPIMTNRGVPLQVITMEEPQPGLTALRQAARARWGIDTLALGKDPFASVEIIRRLEANSSVAMLMDRPPPATAVPIRLFNRPFLASVSAAELARASGCALLPVYVPRTPQGYVGHILPEIPYHRPGLRDREARLRLTQQIMSVFQPIIRLHLNQWYHFVPIWPAP